MAEKKGGFLQGILQKVPVLGGKKEEAELPGSGPLPIYVPKYTSEGGKVTKISTGMGWYPHKIKYRGVIDLEGLYRLMALWFKQRRFELHERLYKSKPPELEVRWEAERKRTSFAKEMIMVHMHMWGDYNVEAIVNGRKKKMADIRTVITINGDIQRAYPDLFGAPRWTATNLERRLFNIFTNWIMRREMEGHYWDRLYYEMYDLHGAIKDFLKFSVR